MRDHPANFLNRAQPGNAFDFNHDSFVDGADLVITRDNPNNFLNAIKLIAPPISGAVAAMSQAVLATSASSLPAATVFPITNSSLSANALAHADVSISNVRHRRALIGLSSSSKTKRIMKRVHAARHDSAAYYGAHRLPL